MEIVIATIGAFAIMAVSVLIHYQSMLAARSILDGSGLPRRAGVLVGMASVTAAQMLSVALYALAFYAMDSWLGMGSLAGETQGSPLDHFYFSMMSYTTLGVGDIYPLGAMRIVSGVEALNGFALIGWTASFAYTLMRQGWSD
ncbi:potassium channel family protein [Devosia sp. J2-20]|uniref:potassium channel family protein n=1 Tax=Devosia sp. J2-20 TaxID=3026161 RepID=UPI00249B86EB|nr:potassium channel family protein [Devosia sp. J2-20]WDQ99176.1 potassium channel family protein [Devosia sp. J2-20]